MALEQQQRLRLLFAIVVNCACYAGAQYPPNGYYPQNYPQQEQYNQYNPYNPYNDNRNPGSNLGREYGTFTLNDRRYPQYQPTYGGAHPGYPGDARYPGQDVRFTYDRDGHREPILPGVLSGWRQDIQGKQRRDSLDKDRDVFVKTAHGEVQGFKVYLYDQPDPDSLYRPKSESVETVQGVTYTFLGIPYALPPIDEGRFKPPRHHTGWKLMQAVDYGPACPQPAEYVGDTKGIRVIHEDCLYLNIFTPSIGGIAQQLPVMVYIHGGDFVKGASNLFPAHIMATFFNVVVVTLNYRLGALGFLSTADVNSPGNYGLLDQAMALQWVYQNIEYFNGDKESITLFGPGAGAASSGLLMVAPDTSNIVNKVIAQSGSALADWAFIQDRYRAQNTSRVFGQLIGCSIESSWKLVNCLKQSRSFYELGVAEFPPHVGLFPWGPVMDFNLTMPYYEGWNPTDWVFLKDSPENLIRQRRHNNALRYMTSVTMHEAAPFIYNNRSLEPDFTVSEDFFDQKVRELVLRYNYTLNPNGTYEAIKYMYTYHPDPKNVTHIRDEYIKLLSDFLYVAPNDKMIKLLAEQRVPVYMYVLNTTVESFGYPEWRKVPHDIEHYLLCGAPFMDTEFFPSNLDFKRDQWTSNDRNMSYFMMRAYTNFARYGDPTHTQILGLHFEQAFHGQLKYLNLNTTYNSTIMWNYRQTESAFWTIYLPTVVGHLVPTYPPTTEFWWEPSQPLQIAFWGMSATCLLLVVLLVVCCMLWRNAKRQSDRYYKDIMMMPDGEPDIGIENREHYDYSEQPLKTPIPLRSTSTPSVKTSSAVSLKEMHSYPSKSPNGEMKKGTPILPPKQARKAPPYSESVVPQTDV